MISKLHYKKTTRVFGALLSSFYTVNTQATEVDKGDAVKERLPLELIVATGREIEKHSVSDALKGTKSNALLKEKRTGTGGASLAKTVGFSGAVWFYRFLTDRV